MFRCKMVISSRDMKKTSRNYSSDEVDIICRLGRAMVGMVRSFEA